MYKSSSSCVASAAPSSFHQEKNRNPCQMLAWTTNTDNLVIPTHNRAATKPDCVQLLLSMGFEHCKNWCNIHFPTSSIYIFFCFVCQQEKEKSIGLIKLPGSFYKPLSEASSTQDQPEVCTGSCHQGKNQ